jgi:hypothetical protein
MKSIGKSTDLANLPILQGYLFCKAPDFARLPMSKAAYVSMTASCNTREPGNIQAVGDSQWRAGDFPRDGRRPAATRRTLRTLRRSGRDWIRIAPRKSCVRDVLEARAIRGRRPGVLPLRTGKQPQTAISWGFSKRISRFRGRFSSASNALRQICVLIATAPGKIAAEGQL